MKTSYMWAGCAAGIAGALLLRRSKLANLTGQLVLITGGSKGLGLALAREFGALGCRLAICGRSGDTLAQAECMLRAEGYSVTAIACDVSSSEQVRDMVADIQEREGAIDILVNNAGEILVAPLENTTEQDIARAMDIMFWGVVHTTLAVLPRMRQRCYGRIATITSIGGKVSVPHLLAYSCAKAAAIAFCEGLRAELGSSGVTVTTLVPGLMRTGSHVNARFRGDAARESAWFSTAASAPLLAMNAERAARQVVHAIRRGTSEQVLSPQARLLTLAQGVVPGLLPDVFSLINRMLPNAQVGNSAETQGSDLVQQQGTFLHFATTLGRTAGVRLNQAAGVG